MKHAIMKIAYHCTGIVLRFTTIFKTDGIVSVYKFQATIKEHIANQSSKCGNHIA